LVIGLPTKSVTASTLAEEIRKLKPNDLVLLREYNMALLPWPKAVINDIHAGKESIVLVVSIKNLKGVIKFQS